MVKNSPARAGDVRKYGFSPWFGGKWQSTPVFFPGESHGQEPGGRKWQPTPVLFPGESQGQRSLLGCRLWGRKELDTTDATLAAAAATTFDDVFIFVMKLFSKL